MKLKSFLMLILVCVLAFAMAACDPNGGGTGGGNTGDGGGNGGGGGDTVPVYVLTVSADKTEAARGDVITLTAELTKDGVADDASDATFEITEGSAYATIEDNKLTVSNTAPHDATIEVVTKIGATVSDPLTITVAVPVDSIVISANGVTNVMSGNSVILQKVAAPDGADLSDFEWVLVEGSGVCTIAGNILVVNANAETGAVIKVKATAGDIESNVLEFVVGYPLEGISAVVLGSANIPNGNSSAISVTLTPANATNGAYTWEFVEGGDFCTILNNIIIIDTDAPIGSVIKFKAVAGEFESDVITVIVGTPIETLTLTTTAPTVLDIGANYVLNLSATPTGASLAGVSYTVTEGADYASVNELGILSISSDTPAGTIVKLYASSGNVVSDTLTFRVGTAIESIVIEAGGSDILKGSNTPLSATINPDGASVSVLDWVIVEGADYARLVGSTLVVYSDAPTNAVIKVKATSGDVDSNVLEFTVKATQEEINANKYMISGLSDKLTLDKKGDSAPVLSATIYDYNFDRVTDKNIVYSVISGSDYLSITQNGMNCSFTVKAHGTAVVEARVEGTDVTKTVEVDVVVSPDSIQLPEVFRDRVGFTYNFSLVDNLPFVPAIVGQGACQNVKFTFDHENGNSGDSVAVYENGEIVFKQKGKVTVTVTSDSGSKHEVSARYTFNINDGYNVYTYNELEDVVESSGYKGEIINIVVLEKPDGSANGYTYGFDLVHGLALVPKSEQSVIDYYTEFNSIRIQAVNKGLYINGNNHAIDMSQLRIFTKAEIAQLQSFIDSGCTEPDPNNPIYSEAKKAKLEAYLKGVSGKPEVPEGISGLLSAEPWSTVSDYTIRGTYFVTISDLELIGNCSYNYTDDTTPSTTVYGATSFGLSVGVRHYLNADYYVNMNNVTASKFSTAFKFDNLVSDTVQTSTVNDIYAYDCYANGVIVHASQLTLGDVKFGKLGATGIEFAPELCNQAGKTNDQNQQVTFVGNIDTAENVNNGNSPYFAEYVVNFGGQNIPAIMIVQGALQNYDPLQVAQMWNEKQEFVFVSLIFNDISTMAANTSIVTYPEHLEGGIINAKDLPTDGSVDTTHQYIMMDIVVNSVPVGKALLYNLNYGK